MKQRGGLALALPLVQVMQVFCQFEVDASIVYASVFSSHSTIY